MKSWKIEWNEIIFKKRKKYKKISGLNVKINELEQYTRRDTIEIYGIEEKENFENIITNIANKVEVEIEKILRQSIEPEIKIISVKLGQLLQS